jgi:hypothetical protein
VYDSSTLAASGRLSGSPKALNRQRGGGWQDYPRTLAFNARAANLLNHTNITAVGTVVSSPSLGQSLAAEAARRVEFGVRFAFQSNLFASRSVSTKS